MFGRDAAAQFLRQRVRAFADVMAAPLECFQWHMFRLQDIHMQIAVTDMAVPDDLEILEVVANRLVQPAQKVRHA